MNTQSGTLLKGTIIYPIWIINSILIPFEKNNIFPSDDLISYMKCFVNLWIRGGTMGELLVNNKHNKRLLIDYSFSDEGHVVHSSDLDIMVFPVDERFGTNARTEPDDKFSFATYIGFAFHPEDIII